MGLSGPPVVASIVKSAVGAGRAHDGDDIRERLAELRREIGGNQALFRVPGDLPGHGEHARTRGREHAVGVTARSFPTIDSDRLDAHEERG